MDIDLEYHYVDFAGHTKYACYDYFHVGTLSTNTTYRLRIGGSQSWGMGASGNTMTESYSNNGMQFTTCDRDNDVHNGANCVMYH